jgi:hypothetical protein
MTEKTTVKDEYLKIQNVTEREIVNSKRGCHLAVLAAFFL